MELIEDEYHRAEYPQVFASLGMIQRAQEQSLLLLRNGAASAEVRCRRGSVSPRAARLCSQTPIWRRGTPDPAQARFAFHWGVLLQLADDLQDVEEDLCAGVRTVFTQDTERATLDESTSRTLYFAQWVMALLGELPQVEAGALAGLIRRSSLSLIVRSAGEAGARYSPEYLAAMEGQSPFRFLFLDRTRKADAGTERQVDSAFRGVPGRRRDEPAFPWLPTSLMPR